MSAYACPECGSTSLIRVCDNEPVDDLDAPDTEATCDDCGHQDCLDGFEYFSSAEAAELNYRDRCDEAHDRNHEGARR